MEERLIQDSRSGYCLAKLIQQRTKTAILQVFILTLGKTVIIKLLKEEKEATRETQILQELHHPNIVSLLDSFTLKETYKQALVFPKYPHIT